MGNFLIPEHDFLVRKIGSLYTLLFLMLEDYNTFLASKTLEYPDEIMVDSISINLTKKQLLEAIESLISLYSEKYRNSIKSPINLVDLEEYIHHLRQTRNQLIDKIDYYSPHIYIYY